MSTFHSHDSASQGLESKSSSYMSRSSSSDTSSEDSFDSDTTISSTTNDTSISSSSDNSSDYSQSLHSSNKLEEHDDWKLFIGANEEDKVMHNTVDFMMFNEGADWNEDVSVATSTSQKDKDMIPDTAFATIAERNRIYYRNRCCERTNLFILLNNCGNLLMRKGKSVVGNCKQQSFLQRIQARLERLLQLLYSFGLLCPEIMWYEYSDGTIPGALPSCLLTDARHLAKLNIASMHDHTLVALQDYFLKCVNNEKFIELLFSLESNLSLRGKKISLVIGPRGWEELYESGGPKVLNSVKLHNNQFICDETDGYRSVQCLQSMMRDLRSSLFHTSTLNKTQFPAVKLVHDEFDRIIEKKQWDHLNDVDQGKNHELALRQASAIHIYRAYHKVMALIFEWITKSSEEPYGSIEEYWIKWQNQLETRPTGSNDHSHVHVL
ncbi:predicted protein [Chaetoceros tenuissimus]|uniref:Uncharacterized protein n=1 Tax=Chaetoceros tenuissimus TaxID=426638 RepID=A0AAD3CNJ9_9STRA|nr:predicted protein [Chaetoceros tenuissimus]